MVLPVAMILGSFTSAIGQYFYIWIAFPATEGCLLGLWTGYIARRLFLFEKNSRALVSLVIVACMGAFLAGLYVDYLIFPSHLRVFMLKQPGFAQSALSSASGDELLKMLLEREFGSAGFLSYLRYRYRAGVTMNEKSDWTIKLGTRGAIALSFIELFFMCALAVLVTSIFKPSPADSNKS
jgi:hypothetical protein